MCQGQQQIFNASEEVLNTDTSRRSQLRSVVRTLLFACLVALVPYDSVFAQAPATERWGYDARIRPDRPGTSYPCLDDEVRVEPPRSVGNRLPASETVTLIDECEYHEIGAAQTIPIGAAQWRVFSAKKELAPHLKKIGINMSRMAA